MMLRRQDSNLQPLGNEPNELPLLYAAMFKPSQKSQLSSAVAKRVSKFDTLFSFRPENGDFCTRIAPMPTFVRCVGVSF